MDYQDGLLSSACPVHEAKRIVRCSTKKKSNAWIVNCFFCFFVFLSLHFIWKHVFQSMNMSLKHLQIAHGLKQTCFNKLLILKILVTIKTCSFVHKNEKKFDIFLIFKFWEILKLKKCQIFFDCKFCWFFFR